MQEKVLYNVPFIKNYKFMGFLPHFNSYSNRYGFDVVYLSSKTFFSSSYVSF